MKTKAELEHFILTKRLATAESLTKRELTDREIRQMPEPVYAWHEQNNLANIDKALNDSRAKAENNKNAAVGEGKKFWGSNYSAEGAQKIQAEAAKFHSSYPQFIRSDENGSAITSWLEAHSLPATAQNMSQAFEVLVRAGHLSVDPTACGIIRIKTSSGQVLDVPAEQLPVYQRRNGTHREGRQMVPTAVEILPAVESITGSALARHSYLDILIAPYNAEVEARRQLGALSANVYKETVLEPIAKKELGSQLSSFTSQALCQDVSTFLSLHPEYIPSPENEDLISKFLLEKKLVPTVKNYETAFIELVKTGQMETDRTVVVSVSGQVAAGSGNITTTGHLSDDTSLRRKINNMSSKDYQEWLKSPANLKAANALA